MYTLEDDHETSSRFRRHRLIKADEEHTPVENSPIAPDPAPAPPATEPAQPLTQEQQGQPIPAQQELPDVPTQDQPVSVQQELSDVSTHENDDVSRPDDGPRGAISNQPTHPRRTASPGEARAALIVACIAVFITALDQTVVVTALPQMIIDLQLSFTQLDHAAWIISAYLLGFVVAMPLMGRVSDIYGRRRIFLLCLTIFGISSICCGLAPWLGTVLNPGFLSVLGIDTTSPGLIWLVVARLVQAVGGGALVPLAMAIAGDYYLQSPQSPSQSSQNSQHAQNAAKAEKDVTDKKKAGMSIGFALGIVGAVTEAGGAIGPLYGALIVDHLGWRYIFYLNVPIVIGLMIAAWYLIPRGRRLRARIDWLGAALLAGALTCLSLGLAQQGTALGPSVANQATPQNNPIALLLALLFLVLFVLVERRSRWAIVNLSIFRRMTFHASAWGNLLVGAALIIAMTDIPIYVDTVLRGSALESGLALLRLTVMIPIGALLGGWLCNRLTCRMVGILGLLFTAAGFFLMSRWPVSVDAVQMTVSTMTAGFGFGLVIAPLSTTALNAVRASQAGMGSAIVTALRMVGMMLGLALLTSWALAYFKQLVATYPSLPVKATAEQFSAWSKGYAAHVIQSEHTVYTNVFFIAMIICLLAILPALFLWGRQAPVEDESFYDAPTVLIEEEEAQAALVAAGVLEETQQANPGDVPRGKRRWSRRKRLLVVGGAALLALLISFGALAPWLFGEEVEYYDEPGPTTQSTGTNHGTPTGPSGPRRMELVLDKGALTALFSAQLNMQDGAISDLNMEPLPDDGLRLTLNLHVTLDTVQRTLPVEIDSTISLDDQQNLQLTVQTLKRDGQVADADSTAEMQSALNKMLTDTVMPSLRNQLKNAKLLSVHTSTTMVCAQGVQTLVLQIEAPAVQGVAAQPTPAPLCFNAATISDLLHQISP